MYRLKSNAKKALQMQLYQNQGSLSSNLHVLFRTGMATKVRTSQGLTVSGAHERGVHDDGQRTHEARLLNKGSD